jgi:hypothetical protein
VRHTYRLGEPALPWFYAIARHIRVDHYRKSIRTAAGERELGEMSKGFSSAPDRAGELEALLAPLSEAQREVIAMLKVEGMSLRTCDSVRAGFRWPFPRSPLLRKSSAESANHGILCRDVGTIIAPAR